MKIYPVSSKATEQSVLARLKGSKLVLPSISTGNVPQLTVDLLIYNLKLEPIARLDPLYLYPFAAASDYVEGSEPVPDYSVSTALDVYYHETLGISIIQQRSPIIPEYARNFLDDLLEFIKISDFKEVLILDSSDYALKADLNFDTPFELYSNELSEAFRSLNVSNTQDVTTVQNFFSPIVVSLIESINSLKTVVLNATTMYVYEGDNFHDAKVFARHVYEILKCLEILSEGSWVAPSSWKGVYGDRPVPVSLEEGLYG